MPESKEIADFNMALAHLYNINGCIQLAHNASINLDANAWFLALLSMFRELSPWIKPQELPHWNDRIMKLNRELQISTHHPRMQRKEIRPDLYMKLHAFEIDLRMILKSTGLLMRIQDDAMYALQ